MKSLKASEQLKMDTYPAQPRSAQFSEMSTSTRIVTVLVAFLISLLFLTCSDESLSSPSDDNPFTLLQIELWDIRFEVERTVRSGGDSSISSGVSQDYVGWYNQIIPITQVRAGVYTGESIYEVDIEKREAHVTVYFGDHQRRIDSLIYSFSYDYDRSGNSPLNQQIRFQLRCLGGEEAAEHGLFRFEDRAGIEPFFPLIDEYLYTYSRSPQSPSTESISRTTGVLFDSDAHIELKFTWE